MSGRTLVRIALPGLFIAAGVAGYACLATADPLAPNGNAWGESPENLAGELRAPGPRTSARRADAPIEGAREALPEAPIAAPGTAPRAPARPWLVLQGRVVDAAGTAIAGATVTLSVRSAIAAPRRPDPSAADLAVTLRGLARDLGDAAATAPPRKNSPSRRPTTRSDDDGRFVIRRRAYDRSLFELSAHHGDFAPTKIAGAWSPAQGAHVLDDLVLAIGGTVTGTVTDDERHAIAGAEIRFLAVPDSLVAPTPERQRESPDSGSPAAIRGLAEFVPAVRSGPDGAFELRHLPPGPFALVVDKPTFLPAVTPPRILEADGRIAGGRVVLVPGTGITGRALDPKGQPIAGVRVEARVLTNDPEPPRTVRKKATRSPPELQDLLLQSLRRVAETDTDGRFALDGLARTDLRFRFRHEDYIDEDRGPVQTARRSKLDVRMHPRLAIAGRVLDSVGGRPVERYGIVARLVPPERAARSIERPQPRRRERPAGPNRPKRSQPRRSDSAKARASRKARERQRSASRLARERARQQREQEIERERRAIAAELQRQRDYLRSRLGPTGRMPRSRPRLATHADGHFEVRGLQPGTYVLDVFAPGHAALAAGPFEIRRGERPPPVTLRLERGVDLTGQVLDKLSGEPLAGAQIQVTLPPLEPQVRSARAVARTRLRPTSLRVDHARTGTDGRFAMRGLRPGVFRLSVTARSHRDFVLPRWTVSTQQSDLVVRLARGASVRGTVSNREAGEQYTVALISATDATSTRVDPSTGRYEFPTVEPGEYFALVRRASRRDGRREVLELAARRERGHHDVVVHESSRILHDIDATATALGALRGRIDHNGRGAVGFQVQLTPENPTAAATRSRSRRPGPRTLTDAEAAFEFPYLKPGDYTLEVTPPRTRSRTHRSGVWLRESITVRAGGKLDRRLDVRTGDLRFQVLHAATGLPVKSARLTLARAVEAAGKPRKAWRRLPSTRRASIRAGAAELRDLRPDSYVYTISGSGLATAPTNVTVPVGRTTVVVRPGPKQPTDRKK